MLPGGWGGGETGGFFHTPYICEGVLCLGAVCVCTLQAVGCLCSEANSLAQGSVQVLPWGMFPLQTGLSLRLSSACPLWQGAGVQIARAILTGLAPVAGEAGGV